MPKPLPAVIETKQGAGMSWFKRILSKQTDDPDTQGAEPTPSDVAPTSGPATDGPSERAPASAKRSIRVFISSTFRDMMEERDELMTHTWPELRRFCRERRVEMTEVD